MCPLRHRSPTTRPSGQRLSTLLHHPPVGQALKVSVSSTATEVSGPGLRRLLSQGFSLQRELGASSLQHRAHAQPDSTQGRPLLSSQLSTQFEGLDSAGGRDLLIFSMCLAFLVGETSYLPLFTYFK